MYSLSQSVAPTAEPVTLVQAKEQLNIDAGEDVDDSYLSGLIEAARDVVEIETGRQLMTATWKLTTDQFPAGRQSMWLPKPPLQSITTVSYKEADAGVATTWSSSNYNVSTEREPGLVWPVYGSTWPSTRHEGDEVTITYVTGYTSAALVPSGIKHAILLLIAHWNAHREESAEASPSRIPAGAARLINNWRIGEEWLNYSGCVW